MNASSKQLTELSWTIALLLRFLLVLKNITHHGRHANRSMLDASGDSSNWPTKQPNQPNDSSASRDNCHLHTRGLGVIFTPGRFYLNRRRLALGDYFILVAVTMSVANLGLIGSFRKVTRHMWDTPACYFDGA